MRWLWIVVVAVACKSSERERTPRGAGSAATAIDASIAAQLMADAKAALAEHRWVDAVVSARSVQELEASNAEAARIAKTAMIEGRNETAYNELVDAIAHVDRTAAKTAYDKIRSDSFYYAQATEAMKSLDAR